MGGLVALIWRFHGGAQHGPAGTTGLPGFPLPFAQAGMEQTTPLMRMSTMKSPKWVTWVVGTETVVELLSNDITFFLSPMTYLPLTFSPENPYKPLV